MKLSRRQAIVLLICECLPLVYMLVFMVVIFAVMFSIMEQSQQMQQQRMQATAQGQVPPPPAGPPFPMDGFMALMAVHVIVIVFMWALIAFNIVYIVKNLRFEGNEKLIWILVVIFTSFIGMLIFWFLRVWPDTKRAVAIPRSP